MVYGRELGLFLREVVLYPADAGQRSRNSGSEDDKMIDTLLDKTADLAGPGIGDYEELEKVLPRDYRSLLTPKETQRAIFAVMVSLGATASLIADKLAPSTALRNPCHFAFTFFAFLNGKNAMKSAW